jgi:hypothetical protein
MPIECFEQNIRLSERQIDVVLQYNGLSSEWAEYG